MKVGRNDPCPCGSGKKYKKCHGKIQQQFVASRYSAHERTLILLNAINDIFNLRDENSWDKLKRNISGEQIRDIYRVIATLWPPDTDYLELLPTPDSKLKALYLGDVKPEFILPNVFRFTLYADEILILDPFFNPWCMAKEYNPIDNPNGYKSDTLKLIFFMLLLEPWIRAQLVHIIPKPGDFDYSLRKMTWTLAEKRLKNFKPSQEDLELLEPTAKAELARFMYTLPKENLDHLVKQAIPTITQEQIESFYSYIKNVQKQDPFAIEQPIEQLGNQHVISRMGANLEMTMYIAQITGAFPFTNIPHKWKEILSTREDLSEDTKIWSPLTKAFQDLDFKFLNNIDSGFACSIRKDGRLESFRAFLRKVWNTIEGEPDVDRINSISRDFKDELTHEFQQAEAEWSKINQELLKWTGLTAAGAIVSGKFALEIPALGFGVAAITQYLMNRMKRKQFRKKVPISVFLDLSKHNPKTKR